MFPKERFREEIGRLAKNVSAEEYYSQGVSAAALLRASSVWSQYPALFLFLSMKTEIDTLPLLETALLDGKPVFAPKTEKDRLAFFQLRSAGAWRTGRHGIREPEDSAADNGQPALILAPGLAFDREGNRLGRGKGCYDRFFAELDESGRRYSAIGFCMDFEIVDRVPADKNDKKMDGLLTAAQLNFFRTTENDPQ
jgi:5-formyltetrahydrofolate cyclo-ligase